MKRLLLLLLAFLCTGCSALPAEERAFAVALGVDLSGETWTVMARVPTYQSGGGYTTLRASAASMEEALLLLDATAPMEVHLGQLRVVFFSRELASSSAFPAVAAILSQRHDLRLDAYAAVADGDMKELMDQLTPATGTRLSKSLDVMLEARMEQGISPSATLSDLFLMNDHRQSPVLACASLEDESDTAKTGMKGSDGEQQASGAGKVQFSGGWLVGLDGTVNGRLSAGEMQVLALLSGYLTKGVLTLEQGTIKLLDARATLKLDGHTVMCKLWVRCASSLRQMMPERALKEAAAALVKRLAGADCDALGLGRQAVRHFRDAAAWRKLEWDKLYPQLTWQIEIITESET